MPISKLTLVPAHTICVHGVSSRVKGHDCEYTNARSALAIEAERRTNVEFIAVPRTHEALWDAQWNKRFHEIMEQLVQEKLERRVA